MSEEKKTELTISIWTEIILKAFYFQTVENFKNLCNQMFEILGEDEANQVIQNCYQLARKEREFV
ncbi:MAG: hypothetical protein SA378_01130 [Sedimentibacter sp.]|uniref:hypothetical protein n=1 Tax=Sedimentibacter sp. TaxID=1960295 RepID=UPI002980ABB2|nr:hypothetical protein [Sedimentibacter sp.]MDW5298734.1 hypothetical protein [Sedimentibacter sp.]